MILYYWEIVKWKTVKSHNKNKIKIQKGLAKAIQM
jgi:hypothetical protein